MEKHGCKSTGFDLHEWKVTLEEGKQYTAFLPGTLDENQIGGKDQAGAAWHPDQSLGCHELAESEDDRIRSRLTRKYTFEGRAVFQKKVYLKIPKGKRVFLEMERTRQIQLFLSDNEILPYEEPSVSSPCSFELTGLQEGEYECRLVSDNRYQKWDPKGIRMSSSASDECQTNWNGILGYLRMTERETVFLSSICVYPKAREMTLTVEINVDAGEAFEGAVLIQSEALVETYRQKLCLQPGKHKLSLDGLCLKEQVKLWDEYDGNLYHLTVFLGSTERKEVTFGVRDFHDNGKGRLALNERTIFLRCEANCGIFPEEGHPPMSEERWTEILKNYKAYGVNCVRFHSWCPPEEAFVAADKLGMLMQPELSCWDPVNAFGTEESYAYYQRELRGVLQMLANHPSFVMLTFGNELKTEEQGRERLHRLLKLAKKIDKTRLYAIGSNVSYGQEGCDEDSDFYTSQRMKDVCLRGTYSGMDFEETGLSGYINRQYPGSAHNYDAAMKEIRKTYQKPVFSFEVGQYEVLPDYREIDTFCGVTQPDNLLLARERTETRGLRDIWDSYVEATGELALLSYREEVEAAMRTKELSGISLLGLQDFPGQGTALVGMMNSHLIPKSFPFAKPERFAAFFRDQLPLMQMERYAYETTEILEAEIRVANFGKNDLKGLLTYRLTGEGFEKNGNLGEYLCPQGEITNAGPLKINLAECGLKTAKHLKLTVEINKVSNTYPIWVYPPVTPMLSAGVYETRQLDQCAREVLKEGGKVYLSPDSTPEMLPHSIQAQFTTDFWTVGTFTKQEGGMGQYIDVHHPIFRNFPTDSHSDWQWWCIAVQRAVILPRRIETIIAEIDSFVTMRYMAKLFECKCGGGKLLFSSMGLHNLQQYPQARALLQEIYSYMDSEEFAPRQEMSLEEIEGLYLNV